MKYYLIIYKGKLFGESGESCNSKYDLKNACKICGTNAQLSGNLIAKGISNVKADFFQTFDRDYLISVKLFDFIKIKETKIDSLLKVVDLKSKESSFYHLNSILCFPKALNRTTGLKVERQCSICNRNGYFNDVIYEETLDGMKKIYPPIHLVYENIKNEFLESSDIFNTWEHIGLSNLKAEGIKVIRYARPMLIVSESIKKAFEEYGVKNAVFEEVKIN